jgi:hypothetical protein
MRPYMPKTGIQRGDIFCTINPMLLGKMISASEKFWSKDGRAEYSHSGIMLDCSYTFEALWTVKSQPLKTAYRGDKVLVARPKVEYGIINSSIGKIVRKYGGDWYPFFRLPLFLLPPVARMVHFSRKSVCSEITAEYLNLIKIIDYSWYGQNPDDIADIAKRYSGMEIVYEGKLK